MKDAMMRAVKTTPLGEVGPIALMSLGFCLWSRGFILLSSFRLPDGTRAYSLFDDAMISMRYAWNWTHGSGLVWNIGERVQGYTSLLMTLVMSAATLVFDKRTAVLSVQVSGVVCILVLAYLATKLLDIILQDATNELRMVLRALAFLSCLAYYPLAYWSLMGMETGLLTVLLMAGLLFALRSTKSNGRTNLMLSGLAFGAAILTRNDSIIYFGLTWLYLAVQARASADKMFTGWLLGSALLVALITVGALVFQHTYYGDPLPNTYTLKLSGVPLLPRLQNGLGFASLFLKETGLILLIAVIGLAIRWHGVKALMLCMVLIAIAYQIFIGGDGWDFWRFLAPVVPLALVLDIDAMHTAVRLILPRGRAHNPPQSDRMPVFVGAGITICLAAAALPAEARFLENILLQARPYQAEENQLHVETALALNELLDEDATIAVFWAGALPYYTDFKAIDMLGKSDRYIARLPPDLTGAVSWARMYSVPGHNKYDLSYSIVSKMPTYAQDFDWGNQDISDWASLWYATVHYKCLSLSLLKDSPDVAWDRAVPPYSRCRHK